MGFNAGKSGGQPQMISPPPSGTQADPAQVLLAGMNGVPPPPGFGGAPGSNPAGVLTSSGGGQNPPAVTSTLGTGSGKQLLGF